MSKKTLKRSRSSRGDIHSDDEMNRKKKRSTQPLLVVDENGEEKYIRMPRKTINQVLMELSKTEPPLHPWKDIGTWKETRRCKYVRMLGKKKVIIYKNKDQNWQYIYNGKHSTTYMFLDTVLDVSYDALKKEIVKYIAPEPSVKIT
jgi:hypothetical protein